MSGFATFPCLTAGPLVLLGGVEVWLSETEARYLYEQPGSVAA